MIRSGLSRVFVLICIAVAILLVAMLYIKIMANRARKDSEAVATQFVQDLASSRMEEALAQTTKGFQKTHAQAELTRILAKYPALQNHPKVVFHYGNAGADSVDLHATVDNLPVTIVLVPENENWRINQLFFSNNEE